MTDPTPPAVRLPAATLEQLRGTVAALRSLLRAAACSVCLVLDDGAHLEFVAADGEGSERIVGVRIPVDRGIAGWVAMSGEPVAILDVDRDARFARDVAESTEYVPTGLVAVPLADADGEVAGVMEVLDPVWEGDSARTLAIAAGFATPVAGLLQLGGTAEDRANPLPPDLERSVRDLVGGSRTAQESLEQLLSAVARLRSGR